MLLLYVDHAQYTDLIWFALSYREDDSGWYLTQVNWKTSNRVSFFLRSKQKKSKERAGKKVMVSWQF